MLWLSAKENDHSPDKSIDGLLQQCIAAAHPAPEDTWMMEITRYFFSQVRSQNIKSHPSGRTISNHYKSQTGHWEK